MTLTYKDAEKLLESQEKFHISLGLERTLGVLKLFDNPQNKIKIIHIAGTNGKGSVSCTLAGILKAAGYKTGLYTSPHLIDYTERIKINNINISHEDFAKYTEKVCLISDKNNINLTEFEVLTISAYLYFYDNNVDIAIIETGLGGRYDATNTVKNKLLSIITSISYDHTDRLGNTIEKIAYEKAGIITEHSNVIISADNAGYNTIKEVCQNQKSLLTDADKAIKTCFENGKNYLINHDKKYEFNLLGLYQDKNMQLVIKSVEFLNKNGFSISDKDIAYGLKNIIWHARLEYLKDKNIIIDGAHNPDAANELIKSLNYYFNNQKRIFIYSTLNTKDYKTIAKILFKPDDKIYYYEFTHKNAVSYDDYIKTVDWLNNIEKINTNNFEDIINNDGLKIITGSLYMIGEIYKNFKAFL